MNRRGAAVLAAVMLAGCTHSVHQVAVGGLEDVPAGAHVRRVHARGEQHVVIATSNTRFADQAYRRLLAACPGGRLVGVEARHSTDLGFLSYTNVLELTGYCLEGPLEPTDDAVSARAVAPRPRG